MCMEDIRIGRKTLAREKVYTTPITTFQQILEPNEKRIAITFVIPDQAAVLLLTTNEGQTGSAGLRLVPTFGNITLTLETFGDLVRRPWFAKADAALQTSLFTVELLDE